jgi:hypothetical protein
MTEPSRAYWAERMEALGMLVSLSRDDPEKRAKYRAEFDHACEMFRKAGMIPSEQIRLAPD